MGQLMKVDHPFIQTYVDRHGTRRYYFRKKGHARAPLPGAPGSPEFMKAYQEALERPARVPASKAPVAGTFGALCHEYANSTEFSRLAVLTRREMTYVIRKLEAKLTDWPVPALERKHILRWRDSLKEKPGAANKMLRVVKVLLSFAVERDYRRDNPSTGIKVLKSGEHRAWTAEELEAFEARWAPGTLERTAYALALYSGQRRTDVARMSPASIAGNALKVVQQKTGAVLTIPMHPELLNALAVWRGSVPGAILTGKMGKPLNPIYFGHLMAEAISAAGLSDDCVLHGLRKSAAVALIDAGCTPHQAAAVTGHQTARMLEHYAKRRDQEKLGKAAMLKWKRARK